MLDQVERRLSRTEPTPKREQCYSEEERPEDSLVVAGEPERQVDIEIGCAVLCVASGEGGQGAAEVVCCEDNAFDQHQGGEGGGPSEAAHDGCDWYSYDADDEEEPDCGVQEFDPD